MHDDPAISYQESNVKLCLSRIRFCKVTISINGFLSGPLTFLQSACPDRHKHSESNQSMFPSPISEDKGATVTASTCSEVTHSYFGPIHILGLIQSNWFGLIIIITNWQ